MKGNGVASLISLVLAATACGTPGGTPRRVSLLLPVVPQDVHLEVAINYSTYTMRNGMVVVLAPDEDSNLVTVDVRYFTGALDEPAGKTGLAHLVEHLVFEVQPQGGPTLTARLEEAALSYNANTSFDSTHYSAVALAPQLETLLRVEAQRMAASCDQLSETLFERERAVVLQELAQRADQHAPAKQLAAALWGREHRFAEGVGGHDVATLTKADACAYLRDHYAPNGAALIIGGAIQPKKTLALVARHFDPIPRRELAVPATAPALPRTPAPRAIELPVSDPGVMLSFPLAAAGTERRVLQEQAIAIAGSALRRAAAKKPEDLSTMVGVIGGSREAAVALGLFSKSGAKPAALSKQIFEALGEAWKDWSEAGLLSLKITASTQVIAEHDDMLQRPSLVADYCQFTTHDRYHGMDIDELMGVDLEGMKGISQGLFSRDEVREFHVAKTAGKVQAELALAGTHQVYELPHDSPGASRATTQASPLSLNLPTLPPPQELRLKNGLRVLMVPRASSLFEARVVFPGGDADDPSNKSGTAELTANLLNMRTSEVSLVDVMALASTMLSGGSITASTTAHASVHGVRGASSMASQHLLRLYTMLARGDFDEDALAELKKADQRAEREAKGAKDAKDGDAEERRARQDRRLLMATWKSLIGERHPYLRSHQHDLQNIQRADLQAFRERYYKVQGATLVVVGGFDPKQMEREIYEMWGSWEPGAPPRSPPAPAMQPATGPTYLALERPDRQLAIALTFAARSHPQNDAGARLVAGELLAARVRAVRERLAASYGISASYLGDEIGSLVQVSGKVAPDRAVEAVRAILEALALERTEPGALALEVDRARRAALQSALARTSSSTAIADALVAVATAGLPLDHERRTAAAVAAVTTDQVRTVLKADLDHARMVMSTTGPDAAKVLRELGAGKVTVIK